MAGANEKSEVEMGRLPGPATEWLREAGVIKGAPNAERLPTGPTLRDGGNPLDTGTKAVVVEQVPARGKKR